MKRRDFLARCLNGALATATASAGLTLEGCGPCPAVTNYRWNNAAFLDGSDPDRIETPSSLASLIDVVKRAEARRARIRMTGAGHSFSDVALTDDFLLRPNGLNRVLPMDRDQLRASYADSKYLVRVESGITLRQLNPYLFARGLALESMGGYDAQTIVGAATTGTHGSGLRYGPIASQIVSMQVVTTGGEVLQVEPANGITDPGRFPGCIRSDGECVRVRLLQDDEAFNALAVSMGCMGVVYSVVLRVEDRYWLKEVREVSTWAKITAPDGFLRRVMRGTATDANGDAGPDYYEIYVNPYPLAGKATTDHRCVVTKRYKLREQPRGLSRGDRKRGRLGDNVLVFLQRISKDGEMLAQFLNDNPRAVPSTLDSALNAIRDESYVARSYDVFNVGPPNQLRVYGVELAVSLDDSIRAVSHLFDVAATLQARGIMHTSPPSLRFVAASSAHLAMMQGRATTMLEIGTLTCAAGADELLKKYERHFIDELAARPHWGLDLNVLRSFDQVRALYPYTADRWLAQYRRFNSMGTFDGRFTDRLGISLHPT